MENNLFDIQSRYEETRRNTCQQKSRLHDIQTETTLKINETRNIFKKPTEEYLHTINKLQNKICKIEAYACFEDGKMKLVNIRMIMHTYVLYLLYNICLYIFTGIFHDAKANSRTD